MDEEVSVQFSGFGCFFCVVSLSMTVKDELLICFINIRNLGNFAFLDGCV